MEKGHYDSQQYNGRNRPGSKKITSKKLRQATEEFQRRYDEEDDAYKYCAVLVAGSVNSSPFRSFEHRALLQATSHLHWQVVVCTGDLMMMMIKSGDVHSKCVHELAFGVSHWRRQHPGIFYADGDGDHKLQSSTRFVHTAGVTRE